MCAVDACEQVAAAGTKLAYLLYYCPDEEILVNAVVALSYLVPGANDTGDLMKRFVELSRYAPCKSHRARLDPHVQFAVGGMHAGMHRFGCSAP